MKVLFRANWVDWVNATSLDIISNEKRMTIEPTEITEIRNRDVKSFKLGLVFILSVQFLITVIFANATWLICDMGHILCTTRYAAFKMSHMIWTR